MHRGDRLFDSGPEFCIYLVYFGLFSVYDSVLSMILMYLLDLTLSFLAMINMMLSVCHMYFLFYVEICEYLEVKLPLYPHV